MPRRYNGTVRTFCFAQFLAALAALPLSAACPDTGLQPGWLWNYEGTIGPHRVRFTLSRRQDRMEGVYFYAKSLKDIPLRGRILDKDRLELTELDQTGKASATIEGTFAGCERIAGTWIRGGESLPLHLRQESGVAGTLDRRYAIAGAASDELVHRNVLNFWHAVASGNRQTVASLVAYPVRASINRKPRTLRSRRELLAHYDEIFSQPFRDAIAAALPRNMFARDQGIMLGNGEVWFNAAGKVFALNNQGR